MNALDIFLVILLGAAAVRGWFKGLIAIAAGVAGLIAGVVLCRLFGHSVADLISSSDGHTTDLVIANVVLFAAGYVGCLCAGRIIRSALHSLHLGIVDRLGGAVFSALEVAMVVSLVLNLWHSVLPGSAPASPASEGLRGLLYDVAPAILN